MTRNPNFGLTFLKAEKTFGYRTFLELNINSLVITRAVHIYIYLYGSGYHIDNDANEPN